MARTKEKGFSSQVFLKAISSFSCPKIFPIKRGNCSLERLFFKRLSSTAPSHKGSKSVAKTSFAPIFRAAMPRIPEPVPKSKTLSLPFPYFSKAKRQSLVVSCCPVPKVVPGSIDSRVFPSASFGTSSQLGLIKKFPTEKAWKKSFQAFIQSLSSVSETEISPFPISVYSAISLSSLFKSERISLHSSSVKMLLLFKV